MKKVLLIAFVLGAVSIAAAQTSNPGAGGAGECKLKLQQAPMIRGIRLGMTAEQVMAVFPSEDRNEMFRQRLSQARFGWLTAGVVPSSYESKEKLAGIRSVDFGFLDGELNFFSVTDNGPEWKSDAQFASKVAETLNLPGLESWTQKTQFGKALACNGFEVSVQIGSANWGPTIKVRSLERDVNKVVFEREEAVKDEARQLSNPSGLEV